MHGRTCHYVSVSVMQRNVNRSQGQIASPVRNQKCIPYVTHSMIQCKPYLYLVAGACDVVCGVDWVILCCLLSLPAFRWPAYFKGRLLHRKPTMPVLVDLSVSHVCAILAGMCTCQSHYDDHSRVQNKYTPTSVTIEPQLHRNNRV